MKYYKYLLLLILSFVFIPNVSAAEKVSIKSVSVDSKSDICDVVNEPIINDLSIKFDVKFYATGDYIKYKVVINNPTSEDYDIGLPDYNSEYISYEYLFDGDPIVKKNSETVMYVLIKYLVEVPDEQLNSNFYTETRDVVINLGKDVIEDNPKTSDKSIIACSIILLILLITIVLYKKYNLKNIKLIIPLIIILLPISIYALSKLELKVESKVSIEKLVCESFSADSWTMISKNIKNNNTSCYNIGDTKSFDIEGYGTHTVRIANMSTPNECLEEGFSQTACGFVVEFTDIITNMGMSTSSNNSAGWKNSLVRNFLNDDFFYDLPKDLQDVIIDTYVVSGHGKTLYTDFYYTTDKLYLFSMKEVSSGYVVEDNMISTRWTDYYSSINANNYGGTGKLRDNVWTSWWLRTPTASGDNYFMIVKGLENGYIGTCWPSVEGGVSPSFRIG